jgi:hypothetical protein
MRLLPLIGVVVVVVVVVFVVVVVVGVQENLESLRWEVAQVPE